MGMGPRWRDRLTGLIILWALAFIWLAVDLATKSWALHVLAGGEREVIPGFLWFNLVRNPGAAFGLLPAGRPLFIAMTALMIGVGILAPLLLDMRRLGLGHIGLGLLVGGGMGNLFDRVFRDGLVVDFIDTRFWPIFNVADIGIVIGTGITLIYLISYLLSTEVKRA
jgi:signal peptidase II